MIIIGEKINGAIPSIKEAIANRDEALIRERVQVQLPAKPDFLDCAPATEPALEYDAMKWLIGIMEEETDTPLCLDSPDPLLLKRLLEEGATQRPGCINSVNEEGTKCETLFPIIAGTDWNVIGLTCDQDGIPLDPEKKIEIAKRIIDKYHKKGLKVCCWTNPYVAQNTDMFCEGVEKGYFLMRADGKGVKQVDNWQPGMALVDFTNPDAAAWFAGKIRELLQTGVDAIKTDFGERIPVDVIYHDGSNPVDMHNYYTFLYNRTVFRAIEEERGKNQAVLFARSATAGSQQFPVHWGGDCFASYASMAETLHAGLSFAMSGFAFWSHDISGFESTATPDLYKRWVQFGIFSTHSRLHGSDTYRVPWIFDEESVDVVRTFSKLKCRLMPYIYRMAAIAHEKGTPVCRPMPFAYPDDRACQYLDLQYMFGESILVAPIFNDQSIGECYLPDGKWISLLDSEVLEGGKWHRKKYSYLDFPVFVRENSLLAIGSHDERPDYDYTEDVTFRYYLPEDGASASCEVPDENGKIVLSAKAILENGEVRLALDREAEGAAFEVVLPDGSRRHAKVEGKTACIRL